MPQLSRFEK